MGGAVMRFDSMSVPADQTASSRVTRSQQGRTVVSVRSEVLSQFQQVAKEQNRKLAPLADDLVLLESGLDSLCVAIIVTRLEDTLGVDPFSTAEDGAFPATLGDFIRFYENAAK
jgi:acyl carrier protein